MKLPAPKYASDHDDGDLVYKCDQVEMALMEKDQRIVELEKELEKYNHSDIVTFAEDGDKPQNAKLVKWSEVAPDGSVRFYRSHVPECRIYEDEDNETANQLRNQAKG